MRSAILALHAGLLEGSRLRGVVSHREKSHLAEIAFLAACGIVAALACGYFDFRLRIPGHAILRAVFPMALGLAVVPRRGAGTIMGVSALLAGLAIRFAAPAGGLSVGALTSVTLTGPLLDLSLRGAKSSWRLYAGFAVAGLVANLAAFLIRGGAKYFGLEQLGARPFSHWLLPASISYLICGVLAGVVSGVIWFQATRPRRDDKGPSA